MKEATAADCVGDSRRVCQIVNHVTGNNGMLPASLVDTDPITWVERFKQLLGTDIHQDTATSKDSRQTKSWKVSVEVRDEPEWQAVAVLIPT